MSDADDATESPAARCATRWTSGPGASSSRSTGRWSIGSRGGAGSRRPTPPTWSRSLPGRRRGDRALGPRPGQGLVPRLALRDRPQPDRQPPGRPAPAPARHRRDRGPAAPRGAAGRRVAESAALRRRVSPPAVRLGRRQVRGEFPRRPGRPSGRPASRASRPRRRRGRWGSPSGPSTSTRAGSWPGIRREIERVEGDDVSHEEASPMVKRSARLRREPAAVLLDDELATATGRAGRPPRRCEACQAALERLAAGSRLWDDLRGRDGGRSATPEPPTDPTATDRPRARRVELDFLAPSDDPGLTSAGSALTRSSA